jgi:hypothetical protein
MLNKGNSQISFFSTEMYDHLIPEEHFLRRLKEIIDPSLLSTGSCQSFTARAWGARAGSLKVVGVFQVLSLL